MNELKTNRDQEEKSKIIDRYQVSTTLTTPDFYKFVTDQFVAQNISELNKCQPFYEGFAQYLQKLYLFVELFEDFSKQIKRIDEKRHVSY